MARSYELWHDGKIEGPLTAERLQDLWEQGSWPRGALWRRVGHRGFRLPEEVAAEMDPTAVPPPPRPKNWPLWAALLAGSLAVVGLPAYFGRAAIEQAFRSGGEAVGFAFMAVLGVVLFGLAVWLSLLWLAFPVFVYRYLVRITAAVERQAGIHHEP